MLRRRTRKIQTTSRCIFHDIQNFSYNFWKPEGETMLAKKAIGRPQLEELANFSSSFLAPLCLLFPLLCVLTHTMRFEMKLVFLFDDKSVPLLVKRSEG